MISADACGLINGPERVGWANVCAAGCNPDRQTDSNTRHNGGSNICFMDGHVKFYNAQAIRTAWTSEWYQGCGYWGNGRE